MKKIFFLILILLVNFKTFAKEIDKQKINDTEKWIEKTYSLNWKNIEEEKEFNANVPGSNGSIKIEKNEIFLYGDDINQYSYWTWGKPDNSDMFIRSGDDTIYIDSDKSGYVKIDDWANIDTNAWIKELNESAKEEEKTYKSKNLDYPTALSWINKPELDRANNMVYYSYKVMWNSGSTSLESLSLVLGKNGYTRIVFVTNYNEGISLSEVSNRNKRKAQTFKYNEDYRYSDYKSGDKLAAVGIGGLVAGTLGVKTLAKAGILAKLLKFAWVLLLPLVFIGKLFGGGSSEESRNLHDESFEAKPKKTRKRKK